MKLIVLSSVICNQVKRGKRGEETIDKASHKFTKCSERQGKELEYIVCVYLKRIKIIPSLVYDKYRLHT